MEADPQQVDVVIIVVIIVIMVAAGVLGALARHILDGQRLKSVLPGESIAEPLHTIAIPGITAAFVVPLFLSVSESGILNDALVSKNLAKNCFILFSFCLLAAFTARNFLESVAAKALQTAKDATTTANNAESKAKNAESKAKDAETQAKDAEAAANDAKVVADDAATAAEEIKDIVSEDGPRTVRVELAATESQAGKALMEQVRSDDERAVIKAFLDGNFSHRSITGLSRDSNLSKQQVREVLANLMKDDKVAQITSSRTGALLYQLKL